ncbi:MAG: hypothetical protein HQK49_01965 [Oligoflexia bacterium]|nr:hypothetical protein [Oligoflexia bacterium]
MFKKNLKINVIIVIFLLVLLCIGGLFYYISSKISPEEIKKITISTISKSFPNAKVELEKLDYSIGFSFKFKIQNLSIIPTTVSSDPAASAGSLFSVNEVEARVPFWALLTGGGTIEIYINKPSLEFIMFAKDDNNWKRAMMSSSSSSSSSPTTAPATTTTTTATAAATDQKGQIEVINFLMNSSLNVKFIDIDLKYKLQNNTSGHILLSRFLLKNLNLKNATAFELASKIELNMKDKMVSLDSMVVGHINIHEIILNKDIHSSIVVKLENIKYPLVQGQIPTIKSDIDLTLRRDDGAIIVINKTDIGSMGNVRSSVSILKEIIEVNDIDVAVGIKDVIDIFAPTMKMVGPTNSKFKLSGNLLMKEGKILPKLEFSASPGVKINLDNGPDLITKMSGSLIKDDVNIVVNNSVFKGAIDLRVNTSFDLNKPVSEISKLNLIRAEIAMSDLNVSNDFIQKTLYEKKPNREKVEKAEKAEKVENLEKVEQVEKVEKENSTSTSNISNSPAPSRSAIKTKTTATSVTTTTVATTNSGQLPPAIIQVKWSKVKIGDEYFDGSTNISVRDNRVGSEDLNFTFSKGKGNISFLLQLLTEVSTKVQWKFALNNLNLNSLRCFLPPMLEEINGVFTGKVDGDLTLTDLTKNINKANKKNTTTATTATTAVNYNVDYDLKILSGAIKGIKINEVVGGVLNKIPYLADVLAQKNYKISNDFERLSIKGNSKKDSLFINDFEFMGIKNKVELKGRGILFAAETKRQSNLEVDYIDHSDVLAPILEKNIGVNILPMKLSGPGFNLTPDYAYTLDKLAKLALNKSKDKLTQKLKGELQNKIQDVVNKSGVSNEVKNTVNKILPNVKFLGN